MYLPAKSGLLELLELHDVHRDGVGQKKKNKLFGDEIIQKGDA
jgi:hypothetical protein